MIFFNNSVDDFEASNTRSQGKGPINIPHFMTVCTSDIINSSVRFL